MRQRKVERKGSPWEAPHASKKSPVPFGVLCIFSTRFTTSGVSHPHMGLEALGVHLCNTSGEEDEMVIMHRRCKKVKRVGTVG